MASPLLAVPGGDYNSTWPRCSNVNSCMGQDLATLRSSAIWIWVKEKWGRLGQVAVGGAELLTRVGAIDRGRDSLVESMASRS